MHGWGARFLLEQAGRGRVYISAGKGGRGGAYIVGCRRAMLELQGCLTMACPTARAQRSVHARKPVCCACSASTTCWKVGCCACRACWDRWVCWRVRMLCLLGCKAVGHAQLGSQHAVPAAHARRHRCCALLDMLLRSQAACCACWEGSRYRACYAPGMFLACVHDGPPTTASQPSSHPPVPRCRGAPNGGRTSGLPSHLKMGAFARRRSMRVYKGQGAGCRAGPVKRNRAVHALGRVFE